MITIPHKLSPIQSKGVKRWARSVCQIEALGTQSKYDMTQVHSVVRRHLRVLMCRDSEASPVPPSLSKLEQKELMERFQLYDPLPHGESIPVLSVTDFVKTGVHMSPNHFEDVEMELKRWGLRRFSFKWEVPLEDRVNYLAQELFWNSFYKAIKTGITALQSANTCSGELSPCHSNEILNHHYIIAKKKKVFNEYLSYLVKTGVSEPLASIFQPRNYLIMGDIVEFKSLTRVYPVREVHYVIPQWWSKKMICFIRYIEERVDFHAKSRNMFAVNRRSPCQYVKSLSTEYGFIPCHLPADLYSNELKDSLPLGDLWDLKMKPSVLPKIQNMASIFPIDAGDLAQNSLDGITDEHYSSDDNISEDEIWDEDDDDTLETATATNTRLENIENRLQSEITTLRGDFEKSFTIFSNFHNELNGVVPLRLEELSKAKNDIKILNDKLELLQGQLGETQNKGLSNDASLNDAPDSISAFQAEV
ncbi:uncharacterized protein MELLADRAFT_92831 [Melampsora larici-populina 98AG31]|uniref:Uncharacterized protein n=1 Tax=Melampsora larici-populina (strain 98AG31 / pathotype 3-4-7) TaxID=747676 RepID=F4S2Y3_MELLP|nr:uncharacterized protein MELLADRAFT_92831 [Melampsora larici-populina 98AG31]EGG00882.1 hypothetical protein MELLADRAFT_92831 [Melampsora larici-populina 98AG31]